MLLGVKNLACGMLATFSRKGTFAFSDSNTAFMPTEPSIQEGRSDVILSGGAKRRCKIEFYLAPAEIEMHGPDSVKEKASSVGTFPEICWRARLAVNIIHPKHHPCRVPFP
jgi:hypothetical protein